MSSMSPVSSSGRRERCGCSAGLSQRFPGVRFGFVPMYIDRHDAPGASAEQLAAAHLLDLEIQDTHGVKYHTYWFDPEKGSVFCLAEGPNKQAVIAVHAESHGMVAGTVLEFDATTPLNAFMGSLPDHPPGTAYAASSTSDCVHRCLWFGCSNAGTRR